MLHLVQPVWLDQFPRLLSLSPEAPADAPVPTAAQPPPQGHGGSGTVQAYSTAGVQQAYRRTVQQAPPQGPGGSATAAAAHPSHLAFATWLAVPLMKVSPPRPGWRRCAAMQQLFACWRLPTHPPACPPVHTEDAV